MAEFTRPTRALQTLFPSSGTEQHAPRFLPDTVNLMHEYPGRLWESLRESIAVSANVVTPSVDIAVAGREDYVEIVAGDVSHDSATARTIQFTLFSPTLVNVIIARWSGMASVRADGQVSGFEPIFGIDAMVPGVVLGDRIHPPRPIIVPPLWTLRALGDTAGVAYALTITTIFSRHSLSERPLFL